MATQLLPIQLSPISSPEVDGYRLLGMLSAKILSAKSVETAAAWVVEVLTHSWDLAFGAIWLRDRHQEVYRLYEYVGNEYDCVRQSLTDTFVASAENPVLEAIAKDQVFTRDIAYYQQSNAHIRRAVQEGMTHGIWAPVHVKQRPIGVIELVDTRKFVPAVLAQVDVAIQILEQYVTTRRTIGRWRNLAIYSQAVSDILTTARPDSDPTAVLAHALHEYCGTIGALYYRLWMPDEDGRFTLRAEDGLLVDLRGVGIQVPDSTTQMAIRTGRMVIEHETTDLEWTTGIDIHENGVRSIVAMLVTDHIGCPYAAITLFLPEHPDDRDNAALGIMESLADHLYLVVKAYVTTSKS